MLRSVNCLLLKKDSFPSYLQGQHSLLAHSSSACHNFPISDCHLCQVLEDPLDLNQLEDHRQHQLHQVDLSQPHLQLVLLDLNQLLPQLPDQLQLLDLW